MGSWNETCALTRLPIKEKDPVVIYRAYDMDAVESRHESGDVPLIMGFHSFGQYDDYSTYKFADDSATVNNRQLIDYAERNNNVWRAVDVVDDRNRTSRLFVAKDVKQFDRHICMSFSALAGPGEDYMTWTRSMLEKAQLWLDAVHERINVEIPVSPEAVYTILKDESVKVFKEQAPAWKLLLDSNNLWVGHAYELPIHRAAFESMCTGIDKRVKSLSVKMMAAFKEWEVHDAEVQALLVTHPQLSIGKGEMRPGDNLWASLTCPRRISKTPLHSNFWDAVEPSEIVAKVGIEHALQNNLFTVALIHTRASLTRGITGSQNENMMLLTNAVSSVVKSQRKPKNEPGEDDFGYDH